MRCGALWKFTRRNCGSAAAAAVHHGRCLQRASGLSPNVWLIAVAQDRSIPAPLIRANQVGIRSSQDFHGIDI